MVSIHRSIQTEIFKRQPIDICRLKLKNILSCLSSLIVPLIFGLLTILLTIEQNRTNREQSIEDRKESSEQRREQSLIAKEERENQWKLSTQRYRDDVLLSYIKDIGEVLEKHNGQLLPASIVYKVVRAKTLNAFRQLDGLRSSHIIRFLYETGQISMTENSVPLDISSADLFNLTRNVFQTDPLLGRLYLSGVNLQDSSFKSVYIQCVNLSATSLQRVNFSESKIVEVQFSNSKMFLVDFSSNVNDENFEQCRLKGKNEDPATIIRHVDFPFSELKNVDFRSTIFSWVLFSSSKFEQTRFTGARFDTVDFSSGDFFEVDFSSSQLVLIDFSYCNFEKVDFSRSEIRNVTFEGVEFNNVNFQGAILENVLFKNASIRETSFNLAILENVRFQRSALIQSKFIRSPRLSVEFNDCELKDVDFYRSNAKGIRFVNNLMDFVHLGSSNLRDAVFHQSVGNEFESIDALSMENLQIRDRPTKSDKSLLSDDRWKIDEGSIKKVSSSLGKHRFFLSENNILASMSQSIDLTRNRERDFWPVSFAELQVNVTFAVSIQILGFSNQNKMIAERTLRKFSRNFSREKLNFRLEKSMVQITIKITMNRSAANDLEEIYFDDISLKINYGNRYESIPEIFYIPKNSRWNRNGEIFVGFAGKGDACNQLLFPTNIIYDEFDDIFYIADYGNHRVLGWKSKETQGRVVAGSGREGRGSDYLKHPMGLAVQREAVALVICDSGNRRVVRWSLKIGTRQGSILIEDVHCFGLTIDRKGYIYISDTESHSIIKLDPKSQRKTIVAGGNGYGSALNQINSPHGIVIDDKGQIFIADYNNSRIVKWMEDWKEGVIVVKGNHQRKNEIQSQKPIWLLLDTEGFIYFNEFYSSRITRWHTELNISEVSLSIVEERKLNPKISLISSFTLDKNSSIYAVDSPSSTIFRYDLEKISSD